MKSKAATTTSSDLKSLIHDHALFFDKLVELIPARFFLASNSDDKPWYPGLSKFEKQSLKVQTRENIKKSRRARFDPSVPVSSTLDLLKKSVEEDKEDDSDEDDEEDDSDEDDEEDDEEMQGEKRIVDMDEKPVTYEELQERLRKKIAELSSGRNTRPEARLKYEKRMGLKKNKKVKSHTKKKNKENEEEAGPSKRKREDGNEKDEVFSKNKKKRNDTKIAEPTNITFGQVKLDSKKNRKKHLPKEKELERAKRLAEAKKDPEKGQKVSWKSAVSKAAGEKVHDDPRLLNKSLKRDKKKQKKNAQKWKEREETVGKAKQEKQKSRMDNIKERIHQKKARKIEKREKKLMRPGFEGRKEGYIN